MTLTLTFDDGETVSLAKKESPKTFYQDPSLTELGEVIHLLRAALFAKSYDLETINRDIPDPWRDYEILYNDEVVAPSETDGVAPV